MATGTELTPEQFARDYPLLSKHIGVYESLYIVIDAEGRVVDTYRARNEFRVDGSRYVQRNIYTWPDGRTRDTTFPGTLRDGVLYFDTPVLKGEARQVSDDVILLVFDYVDRPVHVIETIRRVDDIRWGRTMQYYENGDLVRVAAVYHERKVAD